MHEYPFLRKEKAEEFSQTLRLHITHDIQNIMFSCMLTQFLVVSQTQR